MMEDLLQQPIAEMNSEENLLQDFPDFVDVDVSPLRRISAGTVKNYPPSTAHCRCNCNSSSVKSLSPGSPSDRHPKKPNHQSLPALSPSDSEPYAPPMTSSISLSGFSVIPLAPVPTHSSPSSRRPLSDSYTPQRLPITTQTPQLPLVPQSKPDNAEIGGSSLLPPKLPVPNEIPREESPRTQRWQKMKDRLKEMNEWIDEMKENKETKVTEEDPEKDGDDESGEGELEEAVWVEKKGKCITVHFKCPCSKGYQIVLSGGLCYYKLT